jgi:hypothetical protein
MSIAQADASFHCPEKLQPGFAVEQKIVAEKKWILPSQLLDGP